MNYLLVIFLILFCSQSRAQSKSLADAFDWIIWSTRNEIAKIGQEKRLARCQNFYNEMFNDGYATISVALGYMDISSGESYYYGSEDLGSDIVLDSIAKASFVRVLTQPCISGISACGFKQVSEDIFTRSILRSTGQSLVVNLTITNASVSSSNRDNTTNLIEWQNQRTSNSETNFFGGISSGVDVAIYMGHARKGGGPDFSPPILLKSGKPDFAYYKKKEKGIRKLVDSLVQSRRPPGLIGLLSCKSTGLFVPRVEEASPASLIVSADDLFDFNDIIPTGFALLDALLSERCGNSFSQAIRIRSQSAAYLMINYFP
ncbi:MAG: hypothetical protein IPJ71_01575 [Bdellovibrionales bacterium]|nr:hypothetical protein [Bdellovibrionales bacterium]